MLEEQCLVSLTYDINDTVCVAQGMLSALDSQEAPRDSFPRSDIEPAILSQDDSQQLVELLFSLLRHVHFRCLAVIIAVCVAAFMNNLFYRLHRIDITRSIQEPNKQTIDASLHSADKDSIVKQTVCILTGIICHDSDGVDRMYIDLRNIPSFSEDLKHLSISSSSCSQRRLEEAKNSSSISDITPHESFLSECTLTPVIEEESSVCYSDNELEYDDDDDEGKSASQDGDCNYQLDDCDTSESLQSLKQSVLRDGASTDQLDHCDHSECFQSSKQSSTTFTSKSFSKEREQSGKMAGRLFYMRVCDLGLKISEKVNEISDYSFKGSKKVHPNPNVMFEASKDQKPLTWLQLCGSNSFERDAAKALNLLYQHALDVLYDKDGNIVEWLPDKRTAKAMLLSHIEQQKWMESDVFYWTGKLLHSGIYGSEYSPIRYKTHLSMSPREFTLLVLDSSRTKEYNSMTLGREDLHIFQEGLDSQDIFKGETKVIRNRTQIPFVRKVLEVTNILHARKVSTDPDGDTFVILTRGVNECKNGGLGTELLLGITLVEPVAGFGGKCCITSISHTAAPGFPSFVIARASYKSAVEAVSGFRRVASTS